MRKSRRLDEIQIRPIEWLWPNYIPMGELTIIDGEPGVGKSTVCVAIAALLTQRHPMPGERKAHTKRTAVLYMGFEDSEEKTIVPRFIAAQAAMDRVFFLNSVDILDDNGDPVLDRHGQKIDASFRIPRDIDALDDELDRIRNETGQEVGIIVIDGLFDVLDGKKDSHKQQDMRDSLRPLARLAQRRGIAVLLIRHFSKSPGTKATGAGGGSIAFTAIARSVLTLGRDEHGHAHLAVAKSNLASLPPKEIPSFGYQILPTDGIDAGHLEWSSDSGITADEIVGGRAQEKPLDKADRIAAMLKELFWAQDEILGTEINSALASFDASVNTKTEAKRRAGLQIKESAGRATVWEWRDRAVDPPP